MAENLPNNPEIAASLYQFIPFYALPVTERVDLYPLELPAGTVLCVRTRFQFSKNRSKTLNRLKAHLLRLLRQWAKANDIPRDSVRIAASETPSKNPLIVKATAVAVAVEPVTVHVPHTDDPWWEPWVENMVEYRKARAEE